MYWKMCVFAAVVMAVRPCAAAETEEAPRKAQPVWSAAASAAVMLSVDDFFSGVWNYGKLYIEATPYVPSALNRVGKYEAEVVSAAILTKRFEGKKAAPAMAKIRVREIKKDDKNTLYEVSISYTGLHVKGATSIPLGGGKTYQYKVQDGKAVLVEVHTETY